MNKPLDKAVIMARGLGTRMRKESGVALTEEQRRVAETGVKGMISVGRPFLDYVLTALADAGYASACLVIGPEHTQIRDYYSKTVRPTRIAVEFAIQDEPVGTANAVASAQEYTGDDPFLVINSDNYYPAEALRLLQSLTGMGLIAFEREALLRGSNIPAERVAQFAVIQRNEHGDLLDIIQKPGVAFVESLKPPVWISMNCWRLGPAIFEACRSIEKSPRGEYELVNAVRWCIERNHLFEIADIHAPVLDLSSQLDIEPVARMLSSTDVNL